MMSSIARITILQVYRASRAHQLTFRSISSIFFLTNGSFFFRQKPFDVVQLFEFKNIHGIRRSKNFNHGITPYVDAGSEGVRFPGVTRDPRRTPPS